MVLVGPVINRLKKLLAWFLASSLWMKGIVILLVLGFLWFGARPLVLGSSAQKIQYQTETAEKGTLITSVTGSGTVSSGNSSSITTNASGVVNEVFVRNGDYVTQGETVATLTLDASSQQKQLAAWASYLSAQNQLNSAKAKMNSLQSSLFTANQKFVNDAGTQNPDTSDPKYIIERADWQQAESDYNNQQGVIQAAEASLSSAWLSYSQSSGTITAPMSGTLSNFTLAPGMAISGGTSSSNNSTSTANTSSSQSVGTISLSNGTPQATVNLTQIDITKVRTGQKVTMTLDAFPDKTFTGRISAIDTNGTSSSGVTNYPVTITFDLAVDKLYPNMSVTATIITAVKNNVLLVPTSAVQTVNGQSTVRVMKNGQLQSVDVEIGESNDTQTEIVSGLAEGDTVVTGQTGGTTSSRTSAGTSQTASPFGGTGFGGGRGAAGGGGGNIQFRTFTR